ncbi:MAG: HK97 family phage prohead protease [Rickettsiaceae bacterium]|nr:HK97 family phage prohead protease [Rickettsiaceae bacterium]
MFHIGAISRKLTIKSSGYNNIISGYASVFQVVDNHNDIISFGAFKTSMNNSVKLLWQHEITKPIGMVTLMKEDQYGLKIEAEININIKEGSDATHLIRQGAVSGLSIGFDIKEYNYNQDGYRVITDLNLMEVSVVTFPANNMATISQIKSYDYEYQKAINNLEQLIIQLSNL